ncbi:unnamed protein product [Microthlaspi erraticum]|uniref:NAC domain-containing protein n=1 Tax=Microthlaspi erraticum TaxID=1685480 RepID=A0A6D2IX05_9BRAS|nr:unnamed protein product [Microthlaspi erraticum]
MAEYYDEDFGIHFDPTENQLIKDYLSPKINQVKQFDFIPDMDVYATEPWLLKHNMDPLFKKYEWYYFVTRTQVSESEENIGRGKKAKRKIIGDNGTWKANAKEKILDEETEKTIGIKQTLTFIKSNNNNNNNKKQKREDGTSATVPGSESSWTMTEYMLVEEDKFQGTVLCKIHEIKKSKDDHEASASSYYHSRWASSSSGKQPINNDRESVLASSLEQQQSLACSVNVPEIPHTGSESSLTCDVGETTRDREHTEEGNMINQIDAFSMNEAVRERSSESDETKELTQGTEEDWLGDYPIDVVYVNDQQQAPIPAPSDVNASSAPLGNISRPIQLDEEEEEEWTEELVSQLTREEEDAPSLQWMDEA